MHALLERAALRTQQPTPRHPTLPRSWIDHTPNPSAQTYEHWGVSAPDGNQEPDNMFPPESCGTANYTTVFESAWGWSDQSCYRNVSIMCKIKREWRKRCKWSDNGCHGSILLRQRGFCFPRCIRTLHTAPLPASRFIPPGCIPSPLSQPPASTTTPAS